MNDNTARPVPASPNAFSQSTGAQSVFQRQLRLRPGRRKAKAKMGRGGTKVDLGPARARVKKRAKSKKARAAAHIRAQMLKEAAAAAAVEAGRAAALKKWAAEERRLRAESSRLENKRVESARRVTFAPNVTVTEIPKSHSCTLPAATESPARLRDGPAPPGKSIARWSIQDVEPQVYSFIDAYFDSDDDENGDSPDADYKPIEEALIAAGGNSPGFVRTRSRRKRDEDTDVDNADAAAAAADSAGTSNPKKTRKKSPKKKCKNRNHEQKEQEPLAEKTAKGNCLEAEAELDDMFASLKKSKAERLAATAKAAESPREKGSKKKAGGVSSTSGSKGRIRYTEDGLRVYTYDDIMKDQPKGLSGPCPFDCSCCF